MSQKQILIKNNGKICILVWVQAWQLVVRGFIAVEAVFPQWKIKFLVSLWVSDTAEITGHLSHFLPQWRLQVDAYFLSYKKWLLLPELLNKEDLKKTGFL